MEYIVVHVLNLQV